MEQPNVMDRETDRENLQRLLSEDQFIGVSECLSGLADKLGIMATLLVNSWGQVIAHKIIGGKNRMLVNANTIAGKETWNPVLLSTLAASTGSAAREMARIIGEADNFKMALYEGEKLNILFMAVGDRHSLLVIFETGVALGMVRLFAKRTITRMIPILEKTSPAGIRPESILNRRFETLLGEELERSLKEEP